MGRALLLLPVAFGRLLPVYDRFGFQQRRQHQCMLIISVNKYARRFY
jgi:hypothetical protein